MTETRSVRPTIRWRRRIGGLQSRSAIRIVGSSLYVGTCGTSWNVRDVQDGVHCLDLISGEQRWFTATLADVNEIAITSGTLIVPTDSGDVFLLAAATGEMRRVFRADSAVLGRPAVIDGIDGWSAYFVSVSGQLYRIDQGSDHLIQLGPLGAKCVAALLPLGKDQLLATTHEGQIHKVAVEGGHARSQVIATLPVSKYNGQPALSATPLIEGAAAFIGYARDTYYSAPAVAKLDLATDAISWFASASTETFGNVRTTPLLIDGKLVVASAYTDSVQLLDPADGRLIGEIKLGQSVFQHWSAPIRLGHHHVALGRVDGVCSIIDVRAERLVASVSLVTADTERLIVANQELHEEETFALYPGEPAPAGAICATPAFDGNNLVIGTTDGDLAAIELNLDESAQLN